MKMSDLEDGENSSRSASNRKQFGLSQKWRASESQSPSSHLQQSEYTIEMQNKVEEQQT